MTSNRSWGTWRLVVAAVMAALLAGAAHAQTQSPARPFEPEIGQPGKDVVWVPSPEETVEKMLDMAKVTPQDYVVDLGSGDGRNVIAAARRGARALGVEFNPDMVELSKRNAQSAGVGDRADFVQGDMFKADFSRATVLALFLLPSNLLQLRSKFLELQPGARIVSNTFTIQDWTADETVNLDNCTSWCSVMLYIVPAKVAGTWRAGDGDLTLEQQYQMVTGTLTRGGQTVPVKGRLRGTEITLTADNLEITGRVNGNRIDGTTKGASNGQWTATRR